MATYVDGFVLVVPKKNLKAYQKMAIEGKKMWLRHGALDYKECVGDDLLPDMSDPNMGDMKIRTFPEIAKPKKGETVVFSYIVYKSRAHRDQVNAKVMKEMGAYAEEHKNQKMPFDVKRMAYGGFKTIVE